VIYYFGRKALRTTGRTCAAILSSTSGTESTPKKVSIYATEMIVVTKATRCARAILSVELSSLVLDIDYRFLAIGRRRG